MKKTIITIILLSLNITIGFSQKDEIFKRLRAINNGGMTFYNIDGIDISHQTFNYEFNDKNLKKVYRKYSIKKSNKKIKDSTLRFQNFRVRKTKKKSEQIEEIHTYYFFENKNKRIAVFWFGAINNENQKLQKKLIPLIMNNKIPKECFASITAETINFAGRELKLKFDCQWLGINNLQCPYNGQMNWSIHKTKQSADYAIQQQFEITKSKSIGKLIEEEEVEIVFEEVLTKAKKIIYKLNKISSTLAGGDSLIVYYVSEKIRGNYMSCVLSFWNNDNIKPSGLTPLLEEVMKIDKK